ncbi:unnamed protein product [Malus baccata var. baccata]
MLELIFHRRMLKYPCLASDPQSTNASTSPTTPVSTPSSIFTAPDYNSSSEQGLNLFDFLTQDDPISWYRHMGQDHFLVLARPAMDFSQPLGNDSLLWRTSLLELPYFFNVTALMVEARAYIFSQLSLPLPFSVSHSHHSICRLRPCWSGFYHVPYPTSFHPPNLSLLETWLQQARRSHRTTLMMFVGGNGIENNPNIRRSIRNECKNNTKANNATSNNNLGRFGSGGAGYTKLCNIVDCFHGICEHDSIRFMRPMLQASFCLQPPSDTPTRRSTFDSISAKAQYGRHLPEDQYGEFSVFIPKEDVVFKETRVLDVLRSIPRARVRRMKEKALEKIPRVMYKRHGSSVGLRAKKDAFDLAIDSVLNKIKSRVPVQPRFSLNDPLEFTFFFFF